MCQVHFGILAVQAEQPPSSEHDAVVERYSAALNVETDVEFVMVAHEIVDALLECTAFLVGSLTSPVTLNVHYSCSH